LEFCCLPLQNIWRQ